MITFFPYKNNIKEIATLFCEGQLSPAICESGVYERMVKAFNNETFKHFLANMNVGRYYLNQFKYNTWTKYPAQKKISIECLKTDVVTGEVTNQYWEYDNAALIFDTASLNWLLNNRGWKLIDPPFPPSPQPPEVIETPKLCYSWNEPSYGISYVPGSVGGGGGGVPGGGGGIPGGGGNIIVTPGQTPGQTPGLNFDFKTILSNPLVLVGIAAAAYFLLKK